MNAAYDAFTAKYGLINDKKNARLFDDDSSYYLLCSLENLDENKNLKSKADMFTKRTIRPERVVTSVDAPCYILKITIYRSDDTMVDKFSQVAGNVPVTNNDPNRRYTVINGYPVVLNFAKEPNPGVFERVRDILLATSYTKKTS